jgi:2-dehydro-3-deoxyphosphooctonate aldolase (KDO 8-P synthase)
MVPVLARAAVAAGVAGIFMETHPDPERAKSDSSNSMPIDKISDLLRVLKEIDKVTKNNDFTEDTLND